MKRLFTSESVSEGHPDKVADQISDAILDWYLLHDPKSHVGCEVFVTTGQVLVGGEVRSKSKAPVQDIARRVIRRIGYDRSEYGFSADSADLSRVAAQIVSGIGFIGAGMIVYRKNSAESICESI